MPLSVQTSAGATSQIEYSDEMFAIVLVVRRDNEKAPIGGKVGILLTNLGKLSQFLTVLRHFELYGQP